MFKLLPENIVDAPSSFTSFCELDEPSIQEFTLSQMF